MAFQSDDDTLPPDSHLAEWSGVFDRIAERSGKSIRTWEEMRPRIEAAGFINVHDKMYKAPYGTWPRNQIFKDAGRCNIMGFKNGMEGYVMAVLTKVCIPLITKPSRLAVRVLVGLTIDSLVSHSPGQRKR